ncbi:uncharacterized protein LAESUDRAFT_722662 [Laetiporus sulphureus 93-53]|uniref:Protein kinase domain-containing protein n=1 Tax=Laetiporus sulphureus 93-53 TaxID=1314785 RepID=A0A165G1E8_9APHY|nr:uncharacterized protein LAESUDRAFT_722662 [Laetiporus sulphureus 93-53]KZT09700.1 hypothetical protein LAESUDRAFT_722662 [Laetiporus sulphureus 93-53]
MAQRRSNLRVSSVADTAILTSRKLQSRRGAGSRRRVVAFANPYISPESSSHGPVASSSSSSDPPRAVLVPLQFNLRRLPSRSNMAKEGIHDDIRDYRVRAGIKRKRMVSGTENAASGKNSRAPSRVKRRKTSHDSSEDDFISDMEVDGHAHWEGPDRSDDDGIVDTSDDFLINEAPSRQLLRLRKDELVRLYVAAGLSEDAELLTKQEIVDCIVDARDDIADLPPSSPGALDSGSSDYSSDGGNTAGSAETDFHVQCKNGLRRRATMHDIGHTTRTRASERYSSVGHDGQSGKKTRFTGDSFESLRRTGPSTRRRGFSNASSMRSSPTSSVAASSLPSPPITRLRMRQLSSEISPTASSSSRSSQDKGISKQAGLHNGDRLRPAPPIDEESDLTDLTEVEEPLASMSPNSTSPSPRRLRSQGEKQSSGRQSKDEVIDSHAREPQRRMTLMRKARANVERPSEGEEEDELNESETDQDEEVDELQLSPSPAETPKAPVLWAPLKRRLRPRPLQTHTPPSDGDDERSDNEGETDLEQSATEEDIDNEEDDGSSTTVDEEENTVQVTLEPRRLRSGKVLAEGDEGESTGEKDDDDEDDESYRGSSSEDVDTESEADEIDEVNEVDGVMDENVDLTVATSKSLLRMRREKLVRLCETRDLDTTGTKPQLAEALLQWRDQHYSSPSSTGTARPPSTPKDRGHGRRKTRSKSQSETPPVLMRPERVHTDEPRTPPLSDRAKAAEPELELDLESLGLEEREIPPEKLTKLERIGSGGFKDVFIGKYKRSKVAIAEFRDQLSAMDIKELKLLGDFNHPNIVKFLGVSIPENTRDTPVMIVSELCSNGDLFDYIRNVSPPSLHKILCIMLDIARGLEYLHTRKPSVIHRDCKSSNILITSKGVAKITDFGLAKVKQSTRSMVRSLVGTVNWQAPELWTAHPKYNHKVDVYSCGMVFWEMLQWHVPVKAFPWEGMNEHAIYDVVGNKHQRPSVSGLRKQWCPEIVDLVERMWAQDSKDRPTMTEVVEELERLVQKYR